MKYSRVGSQLKLIIAQLFAGAGIASGYAVGGLLAEQITGKTAMAGFAQMSVILGAGLIAYPLAVLAGKRGRRTALTLGFSIGAAGALVVLLGVTLQLLPVFMLGMMMCGSATASGLQARYAAAELASSAHSGRAMSLVVWATTVGSVLGPSFTAPGAHLGQALGLNSLVGPYLISMVAFLLATFAASTFVNAPKQLEASGADPSPADSSPTDSSPADSSPDEPTLRLGPALRLALSHPLPRLAMITIIAGQMMMTNVMVMTPVHMDHQHFDLRIIGIVVSVHIAGMYALSPLFGWVADRWGAATVILGGIVVFAASITLGVIAAVGPEDSMVLLSLALLLLGIGWSMFLIGGSALLSSSVPEPARVPLQGASDAAMNLGGALMAAMAGTVLGAGGFLAINFMATGVLVITVIVFASAARSIRWPWQSPAEVADRDRVSAGASD